MSKVRRLSSKTIDDFTKLGYNELQSGNLNTAVEAFQNAHRHSVYLNDENTEQLCAFNLGAAFIAAKRPREGLELLSCAVPLSKDPNEKPKGDVYYTFGLGYETMDNVDETIKYFELAVDEYEKEKRDIATSRKIVTVARKLGFLYGGIGSHSQAVSRLKIVIKLQDELEDDFKERIPVLCEISLQLSTMNEYLEALHYADECFTCCGQLEDSLKKGEVYHDLGLIYVHCREYMKGSSCFELALPLIRTTEPGGKKEAAVVQNLGACYNALGDYQRAVGFHEEALKSYAMYSDQNGEAQCFNNLAFAFINLGDFDGAEEAHTHALRASLETGDSRNQWQSLEGLGTVAFNKGDVDRAIENFRESVNVLASSEENFPAHHRLLSKFRDAVKYKDLYAVRPVPPPPVINASMSVNFSESYQRLKKYADAEKEQETQAIQDLELSKTSAMLFTTLEEHSENDSLFSEVSSGGLEADEMYQTDTMLRRYKEQQIAKNLSLERQRQGLRRTKSEILSASPQKGMSAVKVVNKLLRSRTMSKDDQMKEYVSKSRLRRSLLSKSADGGWQMSSTESDESDNYYQKEAEKVEPEHADSLSREATQELVTLDLIEKKALLRESRKLKPLPKLTKGKPTKSKKLLTKEEEELKSQIENDGFLRTFKEIEIDKTDGDDKKGRVKKKKKRVSKNGRKKKHKASLNKSQDSGVFEEAIQPEGQVDEEAVVASSAQADQNAPSTEAIESGTIAGTSLTQLRDKKQSRRKASKGKNKKDICGTSTDVEDSTKHGVDVATGKGSTEETNESSSQFLDKAVQTMKEKKSVVCTLV